MTTQTTRSAELFETASNLMPGGVNSPVRAFKSVGGTPLFIKRGEGCRLYDVDGNELVDYVASWGAIITGHADPEIVGAVSHAAALGTSYGAPHAGEILLAEEVLKRVPGLEMVRFVNSGTEATTAAIRLARAATDRSKIIKFEGNYHGAADGLLAKAGSGIATFGLPDSAGIPEDVARPTLTATYNDSASLRSTLEANNGEVAAVIVEPVAGNMGCVPPADGFLESLREWCTQHGALLIFDEVMCGFRVAKGGAIERYRVQPDLVCMGKVIGGGLPVGAYGGRKDLMEMVAPVGPVYQAGTLSGNPLAMAAGYAALMQLDDGAYGQLESAGARLESGLQQAAAAADVDLQVQRVGAMLSVFFTSEPVTNFEQAQHTDKNLFGKLFHALLKRGVYLPPSALESWFITLAHTGADIDFTVDQFAGSLEEAVAR
ncbi:MAG: glutamate-1-semialdehyde 2,1-aminomutase [Armatimonadetes bacterium]|nr:glutamate-1-semialdehyde 2,1-aminomutase [Armatimonadota bacterium]